jgi:hypothetical protein
MVVEWLPPVHRGAKMSSTQISREECRVNMAALVPARMTAETPVFSGKIQTHDGHEVDLDIHWVRSDSLRGSACDLVNRRFGWRGYGSSHSINASAFHATFSASVGDEVVGTVTLAVDSAAGLAADATFRSELDQYREHDHAYICEITKLAVDSDAQSPAILASLFHVVMLFGQLKYNCTDLFIEVNPRHRRFYQAMLGFERVGEMRTNTSVDAPSQLMHLSVDSIRPMIEAHRNADETSGARSLYPHFFGKREEEGVLMRLFGLLGEAEGSIALSRAA